MDTLDQYLERLASKDPVPGGGSAAALVGSIAAALVATVGRITATPLHELVSRADQLRAELNQARHRDEAAYAAVVAAQALPKDDEVQRAARRHAIEAALHEAAEAPLNAARLALEVLRLTPGLVETQQGALASDVGCAAEFAHAALAACAYNVRINHRYMRNESVVESQAAMLEAYENEASALFSRVRDGVAEALAGRL